MKLIALAAIVGLMGTSAQTPEQKRIDKLLADKPKDTQMRFLRGVIDSEDDGTLLRYAVIGGRLKPRMCMIARGSRTMRRTPAAGRTIARDRRAERLAREVRAFARQAGQMAETAEQLAERIMDFARAA